MSLRPIASSAIALAAAALLAGPVHAQQSSSSRVMLAYKAGQGNAVRAAVARLGGKVVVDLSEVNAIAVTLPASRLAQLRATKGVELVEDDPVQRIAGYRSAGRSVSPLVVSTQVTPYGIPMVQADQVDDSSAGNRKLCIIDSGIDATHEDHAGNLLAGENLTASGTWDSDENSHGTHVAGTVAAVDNSVGVIGVMPNKMINLHIVKVFDATGSTSASTVAKAMLRCNKAGSHVISMSLGSSTPSTIQEKVANFITGRGKLILAAAGNGGSSALHYPASFPAVMSVGAIDSGMNHASFSQFNAEVDIAAPGVAVTSTVPMWSSTSGSLDVGGTPYMVTAAQYAPASSATGALADFGFGDTAVPGSMTGKVCLIQRGNDVSFADKSINCQASGGIGAVIYNNTTGDLNMTLGGPVVSIPVVGATQTDGTAMLGQLGQSTTVTVNQLPPYADFDGTSMATPHASAVAALVWSKHLACTAAQLRASLEKSAMDLGTAGRDDFFGHGLIQAKAASDRITAMGCGN
jgi:subtilisin family serine protease